MIIAKPFSKGCGVEGQSPPRPSQWAKHLTLPRAQERSNAQRSPCQVCAGANLVCSRTSLCATNSKHDPRSGYMRPTAMGGVPNASQNTFDKLVCQKSIYQFIIALFCRFCNQNAAKSLVSSASSYLNHHETNIVFSDFY